MGAHSNHSFKRASTLKQHMTRLCVTGELLRKFGLVPADHRISVPICGVVLFKPISGQHMTDEYELLISLVCRNVSSFFCVPYM